MSSTIYRTAENVAREEKITTEELREVMLMRHAQYQAVLQDGAAFHRRYMIAPVEVKDASGRQVLATVILGGGYGLFVGCAAGDTAAAVVVKVSEAE